MKNFLLILTLIFCLTFPLLSLAVTGDFDNSGRGPIWNLIRGSDSAEGGLQSVGRVTYGLEDGEPTPVPIVAAKIINTFLTLLGMVFLIIIVYAGFRWMIAGGNEEDINKSKKLILNGIIGLAIIITAYAITYFVTNALVRASVG